LKAWKILEYIYVRAALTGVGVAPNRKIWPPTAEKQDLIGHWGSVLVRLLEGYKEWLLVRGAEVKKGVFLEAFG
jgi:hypothetical protein